MPEGTGTFAVWDHNRFLAYDRPLGLTIFVNGGRQIHTVVVFYAICFFCYFIGMLTVI